MRRRQVVVGAASKALAPRTCALCGDVFVPRKQWQTFCTPGCRLDAFRRRAAGEGETHGMADPTGASKINAVRPSPIQEVPVNTHAFHSENRGVRAPRHVVEVEIGGNRRWQQVVSPDGVVSQIGTLRPRALQNGGGS